MFKIYKVTPFETGTFKIIAINPFFAKVKCYFFYCKPTRNTTWKSFNYSIAAEEERQG